MPRSRVRPKIVGSSVRGIGVPFRVTLGCAWYSTLYGVKRVRVDLAGGDGHPICLKPLFQFMHVLLHVGCGSVVVRVLCNDGEVVGVCLNLGVVLCWLGDVMCV